MTLSPVPPRAGIPILPGDVLRLVSYSSQSPAVTIRGKIEVVPPSGPKDAYIISLDNVANTDRSQSTTDLVMRDITAGSVVVGGNVTVISTSAPAQRGILFGIFQLMHGLAFQDLCSGYLYIGHPLSYPWVVEPGPAGGHGNLRSIGSNDPAAANDITPITCPTGALWRIQSLTVQLVQGITQTPLPTLRLRDPTPVTIDQVPITPIQIGASSTAQLTWYRGAVQTSFVAVVGDEFHTAPFPNVDLEAGGSVGIVTDGIGANTDYGIAVLRLEEWVMPN